MGRQPLPTDTIIGNGTDQYRIDTVLGPGGFGVTYLARDLRFDRDVAIKEYFPADFAYREDSQSIRTTAGSGQKDFFEEGKRYFLEEARTLGKFRHPNIVRVLNLFEQFNTAYMVLEFEEGQSLKHWLRQLGRRPTQDEIDRILDPMLDALELIHSKGMFHRDIAPDNIIIRPSGEPVLIDFGAARNFVRENSYTIGAIVKHGYSPPEQYTVDTKLQGAWSDIYSLCATLYLAIMGEAPEEAAKRQLNDTMLPVERHLDAYHKEIYHPALVQALNIGLALKPKERPQTIQDFKAAMERLRTEEDARRATNASVRPGTSAQRSRAPSTLGDAFDARNTETIVAGQGSGTGGTAGGSSARPQAPGAVGGAQGVDPTGAAYPETAMRTAGLIALGVAAVSAIAFLMIGGITHPGGLAAAMLVCAGLIAATAERVLAVTRTDSLDLERVAQATAVMSAVALAIFWLPWFFWQISLTLVGVAAAFVWRRSDSWLTTGMMALGLVHIALSALLLLLASRLNQTDPFFLPLMGVSLGLIAAFILASALRLRQRSGWVTQ
ncbi:MAG: serine/threonine-protein kinase [Hyphomicrobiaceae bacterium]